MFLIAPDSLHTGWRPGRSSHPKMDDMLVSDTSWRENLMKAIHSVPRKEELRRKVISTNTCRSS